MGAGVFDVHSPVVPRAEEMRARIAAARQGRPAERCWVVPDCGLKTRAWAEALPQLRHMVQAAHAMRDQLRREQEEEEEAQRADGASVDKARGA